MRKENSVELAKEFLRRKFDGSEYFSDKPYEKEYRYEHSVRVANIGKYIAEKEGLDAEAMVVAVFCTTFHTAENLKIPKITETTEDTPQKLRARFLRSLALNPMLLRIFATE